MKQLIFLFAFVGATMANAQNPVFYVSENTELNAFSTMYFEDVDFENRGTVVVDDYIEFRGAGNTIMITNNANFDAGEVGFRGSNDYEAEGIYTTQNIRMLDNATLHLQSGSWVIGDAITGETNSRTITGEAGTFISTTKSAGTLNNFGNLGVDLQSADQSLGQTEVIRRYTSIPVGQNSTPSILRYYEISPTTNTGLNATVRFFFYDVDLNGNDINDLTLYRLGDGDTIWSNEGGTLTTSTDNNYLETTGIDAFSTWAIAPNGIPLPVELVFFDAEAIDNLVVLCEWQTSSEVDNSHFEIERSQSGLNFEYVGQTPGNGTTNLPQDYAFTDSNPYDGTSFYRLKQVDFGGQFEYSDVRQVYIERETGLVLFPNPTQEMIHVTIPEKMGIDRYEITDIQGRTVLQNEYDGGPLSVGVQHLSAGMYLIHLFEANQGIKQIKFIKK